jgi:hypothetical protein
MMVLLIIAICRLDSAVYRSLLPIISMKAFTPHDPRLYIVQQSN